jgi:hypothetical protein
MSSTGRRLSTPVWRVLLRNWERQRVSPGVFSVEYSPTGFPNDVVLEANVGNAVPEPLSFVLLSLGIAGLGAYAAGRRQRGAGTRGTYLLLVDPA